MNISKAIIKHSFCSSFKNTQNIPSLKQFLKGQNKIDIQNIDSKKPTFFIETYGCQMNVNDSEIVRAVLSQNYQESNQEDSDIVLINTCSIREAAEQKIYHRINQFKKSKVIAILGCMAQRLKQSMFKKGAHIVCGPDAYRDLPNLIATALMQEENSINVQLSAEETYADITPIRKNKQSPQAFLSIMRGCNNMCSFCIVPFVRGRERSRDTQTIMREISELEEQGVKEITFLGQNVNSYHDISQSDFKSQHTNSEGFAETFKLRNHPGYRFQHLLEMAAQKFPNIRFRFTSPHPKDFPQSLLHIIANYPNLCNHIHLPAQSGNTQMLYRMRRNHSRQAYLNLVQKIRAIIPNVTITSDFICGFCGETQEQFEDTISLIEEVRYDHAFLFAYSMREKTHANRRYQDDVPQEIKKSRLKKMVDVFESNLLQNYTKQIGTIQTLLIEKASKRDANMWVGKTDNFKKGYVNSKQILPVLKNGEVIESRQSKIGDFVVAKVTDAKTRSLQCKNIGIIENLSDFSKNQQKGLDLLTKWNQVNQTKESQQS